MTQEWNDQADDVAAIKGWFDEWGANVAAVDFKSSRHLFREDTVGFGTWMDMVEPLSELEAQQWRSIWPTIEDFHHDTENSLKVMVSPDRMMAVGLVIWTSKGIHEDGAHYDRPGRTTAVFMRDTVDDDWSCVHTHVSLYRGVPQKSHGNKPEKT